MFLHSKVLLIILLIIIMTMISCGELKELESTDPVQFVPSDVQSVLTSNCAIAGCHVGASSAHQLDLSEWPAYALIVNVPSLENPDLMRVKPSDPENSYLVRKVEGNNITGERMPLGGPYLSQTEISLIRQWIWNGAQAR